MRKDIVFLMSGRIAQAFLTLALFRVLSTLLTPAQVGSVYLILSFTALFIMFLLSPVGMYLIRRLNDWKNNKVVLDNLLLFSVYLLVISASSFLLVFLVKKCFGVGEGLPIFQFMFVVAFYVFAFTWNQTVMPTLNMLGYARLFVLFSVLTTALGLILSVLFAVFIHKDAILWLSGQALAAIVVSIFAYNKLKAYLNEAPNPIFSLILNGNAADAKKVVLFATPLACATFFMWLQNQGYRSIVEKQLGAEFLGYLAVGLGIATSLSGVLEALVQQIYYPDFYREINSPDQNLRQQAFADLIRKTIPVYVIFLVFTLGVAEPLVRVLVDVRYKDVFFYVRFGAFFEFFRMSSNILAAGAHSEMKTRALIKPYLLGGITAAIGVYIAALSRNPATLIPSVMVLAGFITFISLKHMATRLLCCPIRYMDALRPAMFSMFFLVLIPMHSHSLIQAAAVLFIASIYFAFLQYRLAAKYFKKTA